MEGRRYSETRPAREREHERIVQAGRAGLGPVGGGTVTRRPSASAPPGPRSTSSRSRRARYATSTARTASSCRRRCSIRAALRMADEALGGVPAAVDRGARRRPEVAIAWQGGEPTLMRIASSGMRSTRRAGTCSRARGTTFEHDPDQRHAPRRGVGRPSSSSTSSSSGVDRRSAGSSTSLPREQGRPGPRSDTGHAPGSSPGGAGWSRTRSPPFTRERRPRSGRCTDFCGMSAEGSVSSSSSRSWSASQRRRRRIEDSWRNRPLYVQAGV